MNYGIIMNIIDIINYNKSFLLSSGSAGLRYCNIKVIIICLNIHIIINNRIKNWCINSNQIAWL